MNDRLTLPSDKSCNSEMLNDYLQRVLTGHELETALLDLFDRLTRASVGIGQRLAYGHLLGDPARVVGVNDSGDRQKALDIGAHEHVLTALQGASVRSVLSEEAEAVLQVEEDGLLDLVIDPIDGSGSIGIGAPLGLLFAVFPAGDSFLRSGRNIIAAGYVSYGHSVDFGFSLGNGVAIATLDAETSHYRINASDVTLPQSHPMIAFNASNHRHWSAGLQRYVVDILAGENGPLGKDVNMRWLAAAVGELHRIINRGGLFMYPADARPGFAQGHIRLIYEAFPIAWLIEQAGGKTIDGFVDILDKVPTELHEKTPLIFGSSDDVDLLKQYLRAD